MTPTTIKYCKTHVNIAKSYKKLKVTSKMFKSKSLKYLVEIYLRHLLCFWLKIV
jgi:hypothetical protein